MIPIAFGVQPPAEARPEFEVTSVKENLSGPPTVSKDPFVFSPSRFSAPNVTLEDLLLVAYNTTRSQIQGGPKWTDSARFDVVAVGTVKRGQMVAMIQSLLADRFSLAVHRETKDVSTYVLLVGKCGHKLQPAKDGEVTGHTPGPRGTLTFVRMPMYSFAQFLSSIFFDFKFDPIQDPSQLGTPTGGDGNPLPRETYPDLVLRALPDQPGLRLEMQMTPVERIIIDRAERPSEN